MIDSPLSSDDRQGESPPPERSRAALPARLVSAVLEHPVRALAFWGAIALPFVYLPLLAFGLETPTQARAFIGLVGAHVLALFVGRSYSLE